MRCCCCCDEEEEEDSSGGCVGPVTEGANRAEDMDATLVVPLVATLEFPPIPLSPILVDEENALLSALALLPRGVDTNL